MALLKVFFNDKDVALPLARLANIRNQLALVPLYAPARLAMNPQSTIRGAV